MFSKYGFEFGAFALHVVDTLTNLRKTVPDTQHLNEHDIHMTSKAAGSATALKITVKAGGGNVCL